MEDKRKEYEKPELIIHENLNKVTKGTTTPTPSPSGTPSEV